MTKKLLIILFGIIGFYGGWRLTENAIRYFSKEQVASRVLFDQEWKETIVGSDGRRVSAPFALEKKSMEIPAEARDKVEDLIVYAGEDKGFAITVCFTKYREDVEVSLQKVEEGIISSVKNTAGTDSIDSHSYALTFVGKPAKEIYMAVFKNDGMLVMHTLAFGRGREVWTVTLAHSYSQPLGEKLWSEIKRRLNPGNL
jgi:hypothetical protein